MKTPIAERTGRDRRADVMQAHKCTVDAWAAIGLKRGRSDRDSHTKLFSTQQKILG